MTTRLLLLRLMSLRLRSEILAKKRAFLVAHFNAVAPVPLKSLFHHIGAQDALHFRGLVPSSVLSLSL